MFGRITAQERAFLKGQTQNDKLIQSVNLFCEDNDLDRFAQSIKPLCEGQLSADWFPKPSKWIPSSLVNP